ncbi:MAG TPA: hypothetical protein VGK30_15080 [Candidatus Binatia bacterium]|jgi:hypothetical protein
MRGACTRALLADLALLAVLALAAPAGAQMATPLAPPIPPPHAPKRPAAGTQDLSRQENQIRRSRVVTRRILHDRRASDEIRQQASELDMLLDKREEILAKLVKAQQDFLAQHKAEIDEIEDLRKRAHELDERLSSARKDVLDAGKVDVDALKDATAHAAALSDGLRERYLQERRKRFQR